MSQSALWLFYFCASSENVGGAARMLAVPCLNADDDRDSEVYGHLICFGTKNFVPADNSFDVQHQQEQ